MPLRLPRLPSSATALPSAESFLHAAIDRLEHAVFTTLPEGEANPGGAAAVETVEMLMTAVVNYAANGWKGTPAAFGTFVREALHNGLQFVRKRGAQIPGCPSLDSAGDVLVGGTSMMAHAMLHFLQKEKEALEMRESLTATLVFGVLIRAFHQSSDVPFATFEKLLHRYFQDAIEAYREELESARPAGAAVH
jgi:hypothetical protein